ncbi:hypothetical protein BGX34_001292 [Mortierella sp. NVP85]|nr:hypothetical protein BGX34_001292 [Mortierella sp. NVP85]
MDKDSKPRWNPSTSYSPSRLSKPQTPPRTRSMETRQTKVLADKTEDQTTTSMAGSSVTPEATESGCTLAPPPVTPTAPLIPGFFSSVWSPFQSPITFHSKNPQDLDLMGLPHLSPRPTPNPHIHGFTTKEKGKSKLGMSLTKTPSNSRTTTPTSDSSLSHSNEQATSGGSGDAGPKAPMFSTSPPLSTRFQSATSPYATLPSPFPIDMESRISTNSAIEIYARQNEQKARVTMEQTLPQLLEDCSFVIHAFEQEQADLISKPRPLDSKSKHDLCREPKATKTTFARTGNIRGRMSFLDTLKNEELDIKDECLESQASGASSSPLLRMNKRPRNEMDDGTTYLVNLDPLEGLKQSCPIDTRGTPELYSIAPEPTQHTATPSTATYFEEGASTAGKKRKRTPELEVRGFSAVLSPIPENAALSLLPENVALLPENAALYPIPKDVPSCPTPESVALQEASTQEPDNTTSSKPEGSRSVPMGQPKSVTFAEMNELIEAEPARYSESPPSQHCEEDELPTRAARIAYWSDILAKHIYRLLECGTFARLFLRADSSRVGLSPDQTPIRFSPPPVMPTIFMGTQGGAIKPSSLSAQATSSQYLQPLIRPKMIGTTKMSVVHYMVSASGNVFC